MKNKRTEKEVCRFHESQALQIRIKPEYLSTNCPHNQLSIESCPSGCRSLIQIIISKNNTFWATMEVARGGSTHCLFTGFAKARKNILYLQTYPSIWLLYGKSINSLDGVNTCNQARDNNMGWGQRHRPEVCMLIHYMNGPESMEVPLSGTSTCELRCERVLLLFAVH